VLRGRDRSRQAALRLALRSVERILLVTVAHEEGIVRADFVIDAYVSAVITHNAICGTYIIVKAAGQVRQRIDTGDVCTNGVDEQRWNNVAGSSARRRPVRVGNDREVSIAHEAAAGGRCAAEDRSEGSVCRHRCSASGWAGAAVAGS